jgi:hypothetical protein
MGIYPDRGISYLIKTSELEGKNIKDIDIFKILKSCKYLNGKYLVVIDTKETDDRLVKLPIYDPNTWLSNCYKNSIKVINPIGLELSNEEKEKIKNIEEFLGVSGDWYDVTILSMTY